jgi:hypothetical protein
MSQNSLRTMYIYVHYTMLYGIISGAIHPIATPFLRYKKE